MARFSGFESLESRTLWSAAPIGAFAAGVVAGAGVHVAPSAAASSMISGTYRTLKMVPDAGATERFSGTGDVTSLGQATGTATIHFPGNVISGHATGKLTLVTSAGTLTLKLTGPTLAGQSTTLKSMTYKTFSGTGAYATLKTSGAITVSRSGKTAGSFSFVFHPNA